MTQTALALAKLAPDPVPAGDLCERVRQVAKTSLSPLIDAIDKGEIYPEAVMRALGAQGAYASHMPVNDAADLRQAIGAMSVVSEYCGATGFMTWCQDTLAWYVGNSGNAALKARFLDAVSSGTMLGGTGLSTR